MRFVPNKPALLLYDALVIADLHIGIESDLVRRGVRLPSMTKKMLREIISLIDSTGAKRVIILGDLKHSIATVGGQEAREIPMFIAALQAKAAVTVVLGNHDAGLKPLLGGIECHDSQGFLYRKHLLFHGHAKPRGEDVAAATRLIASHWHPTVGFREGTREKAWFEARAFDKPLLIMPSFNPLISGVSARDVDAKWLDLSHAKATLLDGTYIGEMRDEVQTSDRTKD